MFSKNRREVVGVGLVGLAIVGVYAWSGHFWVDLVDEGYFLDLGERVHNGQLPYRDFTTYYTPGIFYLFALVFKLFGTSLLPIRVLMACLRGACAMLLYSLSRRVAPWQFAWLPFLLVAALDPWPIEPEPHPSWPSMVALLLSLELVIRHLESRRRRWLVLAGAAAAVAYVFKQNVGAFAALGVAGYVLLRQGHESAQWASRVLVVAFAGGVAGLVTLLMWSNLDPLFAGGLLLPVLVTLGALAFGSLRGGAVAISELASDGAAAALGFSVITLGWLVPLLRAIGPSQTPLGLFVGAIDQSAIAIPLERFTAGIPPLLLTAIWVPTILIEKRSKRVVCAAIALSTLALVLPLSLETREPLSRDPLVLPVLSWLDNSFGTLHLYLPSLAVWAGIAMLFTRRSFNGPYPWYVLFGALAALTVYPRADSLHAVISSPPALIAGAAAIARVRGETADWHRVVVTASLLLVPLAAVTPQLMWRAATLIAPEETGQRLDYADLALERAPVLVPRHTAEDIRGAVAYIQAGTPPGEALFAYPVAPLFNFLTERPNPTRFDHFLPGTLTADDFAQVIQALQRAQPHYVLWDHRGVQRWETDPTNRVLSDYIWRCYDEVAAFRPYLVLERRPGACFEGP